MTRSIWGGIIALATVVWVPTEAHAQPVLTKRCTVDSLATNAEAELRVEWARKCGTIVNVGDPNAWYESDVTSPAGVKLKDYLESDPVRNPDGEMAFTGPDYLYKINNTVLFSLYLSGPTYQGVDGRGYFGWTRDSWRKKGRALYPTFGATPVLTDDLKDQLFPHKNLQDCNLYEDKESTKLHRQAFYVNGYCESACYAPEQTVLFSDGEVSISDALDARREDLMTLTPNSTLDHLQLQQNRTYSYTRETRDAEHVLFVITAASGGQLRVTNEHPIINDEGRMVQAQTLKVGDSLVKADGTPDRIVDIHKTTHFGKVYNISPVTTDLVSNVLVAQGYLVGSVRYQNDEVGYINRYILYRGMPADVIP
ncbi:MAG: Hint domain-containing protein [Cystobacter sp.]